LISILIILPGAAMGHKNKFTFCWNNRRTKRFTLRDSYCKTGDRKVVSIKRMSFKTSAVETKKRLFIEINNRFLVKTLGGLRDAPRFLFLDLGASSRPPSV